MKSCLPVLLLMLAPPFALWVLFMVIEHFQGLVIAAGGIIIFWAIVGAIFLLVSTIYDHFTA